MKTVAIKTNRVLQITFAAFLIIALRVFFLSFVQRDDMLVEAEKPKLRKILVRADRGEIYDRFHIPLASNRICYNAAIYYGQLSQFPARGWGVDAEGKKMRTYPRREYVKKLSEALGPLLGMEAERIEDLIFAKASQIPHVPYILKTHLDEKEYYRLKMMEKDYPGLSAEAMSERYYPKGKVGCHLIGTLGSISWEEYAATAREIRELKEMAESYDAMGPSPFFPAGFSSIEEICQRIDMLKEKAYTLSDRVGKSGIEKQFEEKLRGSWGTKTLEIDREGRQVRELSGGKEPKSGSTLVLSISSELQQFAEELLIRNELEREGKSIGVDPLDKTRKEQKQPWIKGGAIAAIDPKTGEILALASCPRFDPNDFVMKESLPKTHRWMETKQMIQALWDGRELLSRERPLGNMKKIQEERVEVSWDFYLDQILSKTGALKTLFEKIDDIKTAVQIQEDFRSLLYFSKCSDPPLLMEAIITKNSSLWDSLRISEDAAPMLKRMEALLQPIVSSDDRLFAIDLCALAICSPRFGDELLAKIGGMKISAYRALNQAFCRLSKRKREECLKTFHIQEFAAWRSEHQKEFLTEKRALEKGQKTYARPYIDYLDQKEKELFQNYWDEKGISLLVKDLEGPSEDSDSQALRKAISQIPPHLAEEFLKTFRTFEELDRPLFLQHRKIKTEKDLASLFYPTENFGFGRSYAFQADVPQGSVFKLVVGHEGLRQGIHLSLIDDQGYNPAAPPGKNLIVAYSLNQTPYHRLYKGGRLPKTAISHVGKIDLVGALEFSSNPYFSILAGDYMNDPEDLNTAASLFGYGLKTGVDLPAEAFGNLPSDLKTNLTGLYSYAIGQHTLLCTPLQSALMLSSLANGGSLLKPQIIKDEEPFARRTLWMPQQARNILFEGMDRGAWSNRGSARPSLIKSLLGNPLLMRDYLLLQHQMIGKTGTAEILYNPGRFPSSKPQMYKHIWYGSIGFDGDSSQSPKILWEHPELVVVVFLRFGGGGKEAAPLAAQMLQKWREIKKNHGTN